MPRNRIREALEAGQTVIGTWVQMKNPEACELAASAGFHFVVIDMEHGSFGLEAAVEMIRAVESRNATPVLRLPDAAATGVKKALDAGAVGIMIPGIRTGEEARRIVAAARYEPSGIRGACPCIRAADHGVTDWKMYSEWSDRETLVWALIENRDAVENIDEIAASGVHGLVLGPFDLSMSMGLGGDIYHPEVTDALDRAVKVALKKGIEIVAVLFGSSVEEILKSADTWKGKGCRIITALTDRLYLAAGYKEVLANLRRDNRH